MYENTNQAAVTGDDGFYAGSGENSGRAVQKKGMEPTENFQTFHSCPPNSESDNDYAHTIKH